MRSTLAGGRWFLMTIGLMVFELLAVSPVRAQSGNPELDVLLQKGVVFPGGVARKLRPPTLIDGLDAAAQKKAIHAVLAMKKKGRPITFEQFVKNNLNSPNVLLIDEDPRYDANQPGHSINLWFVVYGDLKKVSNPRFLRDQFKPDKTGRIDTLTPAELGERKIVPRTIPGGKEWFVHGSFKLLPADLRVQVQATDRVVQTITKESSTVAGQIDRRFDKDAKFPNEWRPVAGGVVGGPVTLYVSSGGYAKVTQLVAPAGAMLVEYHFVYDEPQGWFNGLDLMRPKLRGTKTDGDVRQFRRELEK